MGSKQKTTSSQTQDPWQPTVPYLTGALGDAQSTFNQTANGALPGALIQGQNAAIGNATGGATTAAANSGLDQVGRLIGNCGATAAGTTASNNINGSLSAFNSGNARLAGLLNPIANGSQIGANNTSFQTALQGNLDKARDSIASTWSGAGRYGSASFGNAEAKTLGDVAAGATATQYNQDRSNQLAAIGTLSGLNTGALNGSISGNTAANGIGQNSIANLVNGIGTLPSLNSSQNADASNLQTVGNGAWSNLDNYMSLLSSVGGLGGSGSGTQTSSVSGPGTVVGSIAALLGAAGNFAKK